MDGGRAKGSSKPNENINKSEEPLGLNTKIALETLQRDVRRVLQEYEGEYRRNK